MLSLATDGVIGAITCRSTHRSPYPPQGPIALARQVRYPVRHPLGIAVVELERTRGPRRELFGGTVPALHPREYRKLVLAVRYLVTNEKLARGHQSRLADHFDISRQRVNQIVTRERLRKLRVTPASASPDGTDAIIH